MIVQGGLITVPIPGTNQITTQIGVGTPFAPFSINAEHAGEPADLRLRPQHGQRALRSGHRHRSHDRRGQRRRVPERVLDRRPQPGRLAQRHPGRHHHDLAAIRARTWRRACGRSRSAARPSPARRCPTRPGPAPPRSPSPARAPAATPRACSPGSRAAPCSRPPSIRRSGPLSTSRPSRSSPPTTTPRSRSPSPCSSTSRPPASTSGIYSYNHDGKHLKNYLTIRGPAATGLYQGKEPRLLRQQPDPRPQPLPHRQVLRLDAQGAQDRQHLQGCRPGPGHDPERRGRRRGSRPMAIARSAPAQGRSNRSTFSA